MKFVIARYYFNSLFRDVANKKFIEDIKKEPFINEETFMYALGNFNSEDFKGYDFVRGTFGKIIKSDHSKIYDKQKHAFLEKKVSDKVQAMVEFLIHHESHLIFIEQSSKIEPEIFKSRFKKIYEHNTENPTSIEIDFISDEEDIYRTLKTWSKITRADFKNLRASNPDSTDSFKNIEQLIKESNGDVLNLSLKKAIPKNTKTVTSEGIDANSMLVKEALSLSAHGYGQATLKGIKDGELVQVGTKKTVRKIEVNFSEDGVLESFVKVIEEIQHYEKK